MIMIIIVIIPKHFIQVTSFNLHNNSMKELSSQLQINTWKFVKSELLDVAQVVSVNVKILLYILSPPHLYPLKVTAPQTSLFY